MRICRTKPEIREARAGMSGGRVGLVPTMGYLHEGHLSLIRASRATCDRTVASIFVNPTQFGPTEDLATYPRDIERDLDLLRAEGVDAVFLPEPGEMYADGAETHVEAEQLSAILIGALRPGHFRGVATVVTKLFNIMQPDDAFFGQKDYQQLCVIRRVVRDLDMPVRVHGLPTAREADGLAMSSRNVRLTPDHRAAAPVLHRALAAGQTALAEAATVEAAAEIVRRTILDEPAAEIASVDLRHAESLAPVDGRPTSPVVILLAVRFGDVLLIDNAVATPEETP